MSPAHKVILNTGGAAVEPAQAYKASWLDPLFRKLFFLSPLGVIGNVVFVLIANNGSMFHSEVHFASGNIIIAMLLSITPWFTGSLRLLLMGLGLPARPVLYMALQVLVFALMSFIPTPGGAGGAEAVFYLFYRPFLAADSIGAETVGWRFLTFYFLLLLAAVLFLIMSKPKQESLPINSETGSMPTKPAMHLFVDLEEKAQRTSHEILTK